VASYFDIPIQHIVPRILKRMNRRGDDKLIKQLIEKIRSLIPEAVIRTTVIVGFPGETDADFQVLIDFIKEFNFDRLGAFAYSKEEDTVAYNYPDQVEEKIKNDRLDKIMSAQKQISRTRLRQMIGSVQETIIEAYDEDSGFYYGRSYAFAPDDTDGYIVFQSVDKQIIGDIVNVKIKEAIMYDLLGDKVS